MEKEAQTRIRCIDQQLSAAGWPRGSQRLIDEFVLGAAAGQPSEFADYALIDSRQVPIAIVEAKRSSRSALEGERQAADYADRMRGGQGAEPFVFLANGNEIWFWDRSLYKAIFDHFDSIQVGLTATPTDFIDHNTFELFECEDGLPTFHYSYDEAIHDGHLVPYRPVHVAKTGFQVEGLKPGTLPPEIEKELKEQGIEPSELDFEGTDFEKRITNTGTNDAIVREFMDVSIKDAVGTLPGKTIIFAVSHNHALELYQSFNRLYPELQRRGLAKVIDSHMERADKTLDDFKNRDFPRVAISVDMLDTGIDVPAIRNLVFAKPVFSHVKFWQMIGRGTRPWKDPLSGKQKKDFLIIDHWDNFAYFQINTAGDGETPATEPLPTRTFRLRLEAAEILAGRGEAELAGCECAALRAMLRDVPLDNINVAPHADEIRHLMDSPDAWLPLDQAKHKHLVLTIAPLLRFSSASGYTTLQFENLTQLLALAALKAEAEEIERLRARTLENLSLLPRDLPEIRAVADELCCAMTDAYWQPIDYQRAIHIQRVFTPLMRFRARRETGQMVRLSLRDEIRDRHWIIFGPSGEGSFADTYRQQVEAFIRDLAEQSPALQKLREGGALTDQEFEEIAHVLERPDLFITEERLREVYHQPIADLKTFLRHILGIAALPSREKQVSEAFDDWVAIHPRLNATQLMFVRTLRQSVLNRAQVCSLEQLRQSPFSRIGDPEKLFDKNTLKELMKLAAESAA